MTRQLKLFGFFAGSAFGLGSLVYVVLRAIMPHGWVFGAPPRMFLYHWEHPFQYIALVALTYGAIATLCAFKLSLLNGWRLRIAIVATMLVVVLAASAPGGVLWKIHDMQAGFFTKGSRFWEDLLWGASSGLQIGWLIIALSVPYNIFGLIIGYWVTWRGFKIAAIINQTGEERTQPATGGQP
jgi:hypothetical protein